MTRFGRSPIRTSAPAHPFKNKSVEFIDKPHRLIFTYFYVHSNPETLKPNSYPLITNQIRDRHNPLLLELLESLING